MPPKKLTYGQQGRSGGSTAVNRGRGGRGRGRGGGGAPSSDIKCGGFKTLSDEDVAKLASRPNVQIHKSVPIGTYAPITADELQAAKAEFRPLYLRLRDENPSWSELATRVYMYENDEAFKNFFDSAEIMSEILTVDIFSEDSWDEVVGLQDSVLKKDIPLSDMIGKLIQSHKFDNEAMKTFQNTVEKKYGGSVSAFMLDEMEDSPASKKYTEKYLRSRREERERDAHDAAQAEAERAAAKKNQSFTSS